MVMHIQNNLSDITVTTRFDSRSYLSGVSWYELHNVDRAAWVPALLESYKTLNKTIPTLALRPFETKATSYRFRRSQTARPVQRIRVEMSDAVAHLQHPQLGIVSGRRTNGTVQFLGLKYGVLRHRFAVPEINLASQEQDIDATRYGYVGCKTLK